MENDTSVEIVLKDKEGKETVLKETVALLKDEVIDSSFMSVKALTEYYETEIQDAKDSEILLSLHLKATMMKVSDPILFGHCIRVYFKKAFDKHGDYLEELGADPNRGLTSVYSVLREKAPAAQAEEIIHDFEACYEGEDRPWLAMVDSDRGITNLHAPNDIIIDASMPVVIRGKSGWGESFSVSLVTTLWFGVGLVWLFCYKTTNLVKLTTCLDSGKMWNKLGEMEDTKCLIPDRCYATTYQEAITYVKTKGQFDVATMGSVVRIMVAEHLRKVFFLNSS